MAFGVPNIASAGVAIVPDFGSFRGQLEGGLRSHLSGPGLAAAAGLTGLAVAATAFADQAVDAFVPFENSLSKIVGLAGVAQDQVDQWGVQVLELGPKFAKSAQEMADALLFIASSGLKGAAAMDALEKSAKASAAGLGATETVADAVTSAMNAYGPAVLSAGQATDILVATVREGKAEAEELSGSIGKVIPVAAQLGVSFDEVGGAVASMTLRGLAADEATTALRGVLVSLLNPSAQAADRLAELGITFGQLRHMLREDGLLDTLTFLQDALHGDEEAISDIFDDVRALTGFLNLVGAGAEQTRAVMDDLAHSTGSLDDAFAAVADDEGFRMQQALQEINAEMIQAGERIVPNLVLALRAIAPTVTNDIIPAITDLALVFADFAKSPIPNILVDLGTTITRGATAFGHGIGLIVSSLNPFNSAGKEAARTAIALDVAINEVLEAVSRGEGVVEAVANQFAFMARNTEVSVDEFERLAAAGRLTNDELAQVGRTFIQAVQQGRDLGLSIGELQIIFGRYIPNIEQMVGATDSWVNALGLVGPAATDAATEVDPLANLLGELGIETGDAADEMARLEDRLLGAAAAQENMSAILLAQASPLVAAVRDYNNLVKTYERVTEDGKIAGQEIFELGEQVIKTSSSFREFNASNPEEAIVAIAAAVGVLPEEVEAALREVGIIVDEESDRIGADLIEGIVARARELASPLGLALEEVLSNINNRISPIIIPYDIQFRGMTFPTPSDFVEGGFGTGGGVGPSAWELAQNALQNTLDEVIR